MDPFVQRRLAGGLGDHLGDMELMMRKLLTGSAGLFGLVAAAPALAGPWTVGAQSVAYTTHTGLAGTPTGYSFQPTAVDPTDLVPASYIDSVTATGVDYTAHALGTSEAKYRFQCNVTYEGMADSITAPGTPIGPHRHAYSGSPFIDKDSDYTSLRNRAVGGVGTCNGREINLSAYWQPPLRHKLASGAWATIIPDTQTVYYIRPEYTNVAVWEMPRGMKIVGGQNPGNTAFNNAGVVAEIAATSGYLSLLGTQGEVGNLTSWYCSTPIGNGTTAYSPNTAAPYHQPYLVDQNSHLTVACDWSAGSQLIADQSSPECWDTVNLDSPDGRSHLRYAQPRTSNGNLRDCPDGWVAIPVLEMKTAYGFKSDAELAAVHLSSDMMNPTTTPGDATSSDPCRQVGPWFCAGHTLHFDWIPAWHWPTFEEIEANCLGIASALFPSPQPALCDSGAYGANKRLLFTPLITTHAALPESTRHFTPTSGPNTTDPSNNMNMTGHN
jgi:hypothetical protein